MFLAYGMVINISSAVTSWKQCCHLGLMWWADIWAGYSDPVWINMEISWLLQVSLPQCLGAHGPLAQEPTGTSEAALCSAQINVGGSEGGLAGLHRIWEWSKTRLHLQTFNKLALQWTERSFSPGTAVRGGCKIELQLFLRKVEGMFRTLSWDKLLQEWVQPPFIITLGKACVMPSLHHLHHLQPWKGPRFDSTLPITTGCSTHWEVSVTGEEAKVGQQFWFLLRNGEGFRGLKTRSKEAMACSLIHGGVTWETWDSYLASAAL